VIREDAKHKEDFECVTPESWETIQRFCPDARPIPRSYEKEKGIRVNVEFHHKKVKQFYPY